MLEVPSYCANSLFVHKNVKDLAHLFKRVKNSSLIRMFGKALSAKDEKVF